MSAEAARTRTEARSAPASPEFSWRLYVEMVAADLTPPELSITSGVPERMIRRWLDGSQPPVLARSSLNNVHAVARSLGVSALFLLTGEKR